MDADDSESQTPRNPEAPDYIKSFEEEVLNQVKNLIEMKDPLTMPMDRYHYFSIAIASIHYEERISLCESGRADDIEQFYSDSNGTITVSLSTPSAYVTKFIRHGSTEVLDDCFNELRDCLEPQFSEEVCIFCSQELGFNQTMWRLPCAHEMHYHCCFKWMEISQNPSCPFCRRAVIMDRTRCFCKGDVFVVRSQPIMPSLLNYISSEDFNRWRRAYWELFEGKAN